MQRFRTNGPMGPVAFGGMGLTPGVKGLLIANVAVFILQTFSPVTARGVDAVTRLFAFTPGEAIMGLQVWRFFTYMFLHGDFFHIAFNMFALWMFGSQVEARWGRNAFLSYYVVCGLGGALTYGAFNLFGSDAFHYMVGASGAIYGILLAYGLTFPNAIILVGFFLPMKAKYAVILFGLIELMATASGTGGNVAHLAHLGGMLTGWIFLRLTVPGVGGGPADLSAAWRRYRTKQRMRVVRPDDRQGGGNGRTSGGGSSRPGTPPDVDAILDKISREGLDSLTAEEQEILRRAGRR
jgi:membrane associated rhomboid family serine protease